MSLMARVIGGPLDGNLVSYQGEFLYGPIKPLRSIEFSQEPVPGLPEAGIPKRREYKAFFDEDGRCWYWHYKAFANEEMRRKTMWPRFGTRCSLCYDGVQEAKRDRVEDDFAVYESVCCSCRGDFPVRVAAGMPESEARAFMERMGSRWTQRRPLDEREWRDKQQLIELEILASWRAEI